MNGGRERHLEREGDKVLEEEDYISRVTEGG